MRASSRRRLRGAALAEDVVGLLDALGAEGAIVFGHDWGAWSISAARGSFAHAARLEAARVLGYDPPMPTRERVVSIIVDRELHRRMQTEANRQRKSMSRFVRDVLAERLRPQHDPRRSGTALLRLCGLAHGELSAVDVDRELYGR